MQLVAKYIERIQERAGRSLDTLVFRGQGNSKWLLRSGAVRRLDPGGIHAGEPDFFAEYLEYHTVLLDRARRVMPYGERNQSSTHLQILGKLQHFGAATGLLDFTHNPLVALWFACENQSEEGKSQDGKIFFLRKELPNTSHLPPDIETGDVQNVLSLTQDSTNHKYYLWEPMAEDDASLRIVSQRSVFVIGPPVIEEIHVYTVDIDEADKEPMREELAQLDVSERTIYRDLVGFCRQESADVPYVPPADPVTYLRRGNSAFRRGEYLQAVEAYDRCLEHGGDKAEIFYLRGNANAANGRFDDAIQDYSDAQNISTSPISGGKSKQLPWFFYAIYYNRGNMWACQNKHEKAIENYRQASFFSPQFESAYFNCGNSHYLMQQFVEAVSCFDKVLEISPESIPALRNKLLALILMEKFDDADVCYAMIKRITGKEPAGLEMLPLLKGILAGLPDYTLERRFADHSFYMTFTHPDYTGDNHSISFQGIQGNTGNVGGGHHNLPVSKGFPGGPGILATFFRGSNN